MITKEEVKRILDEILQGTDIFAVHATVSMTNKITVYIDSMAGITLDQCVAVSRSIESKLDREVEDFELEVSSPGAAQPFMVQQQYLKNIGKEVEVLLTNGEKLKGILKSNTLEDVALELLPEKKKKAKAGEIVVKTILFKDIKQTKALFKVK